MTPQVWNRLLQIAHCMEVLEYMRSCKSIPGHELYHLLGDMDWLTELHELLYDEGHAERNRRTKCHC